ncbi:MAG: DUF2382 domain-containing protein [Cyanobacteria bacterium P01_D01_bin.56]
MSHRYALVQIERSAPTNGAAVAGTPDFNEGEIVRMETYGEEASIRKEASVREEVNVRKETDRDVITEQETLRREKLDIKSDGNPNIAKR